MKKLLLILGLLNGVNLTIFSQEADRKFTVQTSPILFVSSLVSLGTRDDTGSSFIMDLESQYKINDIINVSLTVSFLVRDSNRTGYRTVYDTTDDGFLTYHNERYSFEENVFQINFKPMFVYRPFKTGIEGFYIGVYPNIGWQTLKTKGIDDDLLAEIGVNKNNLWTEIGVGINTGYKWVLSKGFTLQLGGGIGKTWSIPEKPDNSISFMNSDGRQTLRNFDIHLVDFKLGYSF